MDLSLNLAAAAESAGSLAAFTSAAIGGLLLRIVAALAVVIIGFAVAAWAGRAVGRLLGRSGRLEATIIPVITATIRYAVMIFVAVAALSQLGVQTTSILTVLGAAGLAIGLALQGTLQNIAAGIMLLWLRPFRINDYVEVPAVAGKVEEVGLFATRLRTWDGIYKFVPNSELWNRILTNYDRNPTRLIVLDFAVSSESDIAAARRALRAFAETHPKVMKTPPPEVVPAALTDSGVTLQLRAWAANPDFWSAKWDLIEGGKRALEEAGVTATVPKLVRLIGDVAGLGSPDRAA